MTALGLSAQPTLKIKQCTSLFFCSLGIAPVFPENEIFTSPKFLHLIVSLQEQFAKDIKKQSVSEDDRINFAKDVAKRYTPLLQNNFWIGCTTMKGPNEALGNLNAALQRLKILEKNKSGTFFENTYIKITANLTAFIDSLGRSLSGIQNELLSRHKTAGSVLQAKLKDYFNKHPTIETLLKHQKEKDELDKEDIALNERQKLLAQKRQAINAQWPKSKAEPEPPELVAAWDKNEAEINAYNIARGDLTERIKKQETDHRAFFEENPICIYYKSFSDSLSQKENISKSRQASKATPAAGEKRTPMADISQNPKDTNSIVAKP